MNESTHSKTFRTQGDTGIVYTVVETVDHSGTGAQDISYALTDGRAVQKISDDQFEIIETKELLSRL